MSKVQIYTPSQNWHWVTLSGPDAQDFLHRLSTSHVRDLPLASGTQSCFLTGQGKMRGYFTLWNLSPTEYALEFDGGFQDRWKTSLLATIDQYTFAEKMTLTDRTPSGTSSLACRWIFVDTSEEESLLQKLGISSISNALNPNLAWGTTWTPHPEIRICHHGISDYGRAWLTVWGASSSLTSWIERTLPEASAIDESQTENWRIDRARPRIGAEIDENTLPLEVGLVDAIAQAKGCYPGQEVIERIIALGSPARRLVKLELSLADSDGPARFPQPGDRIIHSTEIGYLTSVSQLNALGFVKKIYAQEGLEIQIIPKENSREYPPMIGKIIRVTTYAP